MRRSIIWELVKVNILYSNPSALSTIKKKQEKKKNPNFSPYKSVLRQNLLTIAIITISYSALFLANDFKKDSSALASMLGLYFLMSFGSLFSSMYSIFYDSKDLKLYASMPIRQSEIFTAKLISALSIGATFILPILPVLIVAYWQISGSLLSIGFAVINFIAISLMIVVVSLILNHYSSKLILRSKYKALFSTIFTLLPMIFILLGVGILNVFNQRRFSGHAIHQYHLPYFDGFYEVMKNPFGFSSLLNYFLPFFLSLLGVYFIVKKIMPDYFETGFYQKKDTTTKSTKVYQDKSLSKVLIRHHLGTLKDKNLLTQAYFLPVVMVFSFLTPVLTKGLDVILHQEKFIANSIAMGVIFALLTMMMSFIRVSLSLEKENYAFIKTLPINEKSFLHQKLLLHYFVQTLPILVFGLVVALFLRLNHPLIFLGFSFSYLAVSYVIAENYFIKDVRNPEFHWQDTTQLLMKGRNQWLFSLIYFALIILMVALNAVIAVISNWINPYLSAAIVFSIVLITCGGYHLYMNTHFWKKL